MTGNNGNRPLVWISEPVGALFPGRIKGGCGGDCECNKAGFKCNNFVGRSHKGVVRNR